MNLKNQIFLKSVAIFPYVNKKSNSCLTVLKLVLIVLLMVMTIPSAAWANSDISIPAKENNSEQIVTFKKPENSSKQQLQIQPYLDRVISKVTDFRLDNGLNFIVLERHEAPVISFVTYADVGGVDEPDGKTGVAHFLEHLAFKGTTRIGTQNYKLEKPLLEKLDQLAAQIQTAKVAKQDAKVVQLEKEFERIESEAAKYQKQNEFGQIVEQSGGVDLNAATSSDSTTYYYNFPANKLELWMSLESERFLDPVFREFYKEKQVILEERRLRTENSPIGQMTEALVDKAFKVHPYHRPVIGYTQDIEKLTRKDVQDFFEKHYIPSKLTIGIVGDVNPVEVKRLAQVYFGRYRAKTVASESIPVEPKQTEPREITLNLVSQPWYFEGYHRPNINHPNDTVYDLIVSILSDGRTSRLYKSLVEEQQVALYAAGFNGFPGDKYPNLILFEADTAPGHTVDEVATALRKEIELLKTKLVSQKELERVKKQARVGMLGALNSNMGMAGALVEYQVKTGNWRNLFKELDEIAKITPADIQRVAKETFNPENRTVGKILPKAATK